MVIITKGKEKKRVSISSYDNFFKTNGWVIESEGSTPSETHSKVEKVEEKKPEVEDVEETDSTDDVSEDEWDDALSELQDDEVEKPLSDMNKEELLEKAKSLNIKVPNGASNKQIRELIKASK